MEYRISVVVPSFNSERYIVECLDSIFAQTLQPIEVIVVDDQSSDGTEKVVAAYARDVRFIANAVNLGPPATRNVGIEGSSGNFVAFLDADDTWHPEKLQRQVAEFEADPSLDYCLTYVQSLWEDEVAEEGVLLQEHPRAQPIPGYATGPLLARREAFDRIGLLNPELWSTDSADWFLRADRAGLKKKVLPDVLVYRRVHVSNMTKRMSDRFRLEWLTIIKQRLDEKRESGEIPKQ